MCGVLVLRRAACVSVLVWHTSGMRIARRPCRPKATHMVFHRILPQYKEPEEDKHKRHTFN